MMRFQWLFQDDGFTWTRSELDERVAKSNAVTLTACQRAVNKMMFTVKIT